VFSGLHLSFSHLNLGLMRTAPWEVNVFLHWAHFIQVRTHDPWAPPPSHTSLLSYNVTQNSSVWMRCLSPENLPLQCGFLARPPKLTPPISENPRYPSLSDLPRHDAYFGFGLTYVCNAILLARDCSRPSWLMGPTCHHHSGPTLRGPSLIHNLG